MAGCSTYRCASLPAVEPVAADDKSDEEIWVGQNARITLRSDEVIAGTVYAVSSDTITVGHAGNYGLEKTSAGVNEIALIEVEHSSNIANIVTFAVLGIAIVGVIFAASCGGGLTGALVGSN